MVKRPQCCDWLDGHQFKDQPSSLRMTVAARIPRLEASLHSALSALDVISSSGCGRQGMAARSCCTGDGHTTRTTFADGRRCGGEASSLAAGTRRIGLRNVFAGFVY